jgi:hypothetical protein
MKNYISKIDSERFGFKISKLNSFEPDLKSQIKQLKINGVKLIISRINSNNIKLLNELEDLNFRIKDTQLTVTHSFSNTEKIIEDFSQINDVSIEEAMENDTNIIANLAYEAFKGYGHYSVDEKLDKEKSNYIYKDWAQRSCTDKSVADYMFIAKINNQIAGFLTLKINNERGKVYGIQHLGAVDKNFRNYNVFRNLILKCLIAGIEYKHNWHESYLLSTNYAVLRSYLKMGFKITDSNHTMHCWL